MLIMKQLLIVTLMLVTKFALAQLPSISAISPSWGIPGSSLTITGTNFNTTTSNNIVYFGAVKATVTSASATSLTVTVPLRATYSPVSVLNTASSLAGYSRYPFLPVFDNSLYNITDLLFSDKRDFTTGTNPYGIAFGDITGDGKTDMVTVNNSADKISVLRNNGSSSNMSFAS